MMGESGPHRRPWAATSLVVAAFILASCGVPDDGTTRTVRSGDVPHRLLGAAGSSGAPAATPTGPTVTIPRVYLIDQDRQLVPQEQPLEASGMEPLLADLLAALATAPTQQQRAMGLSSALESETGLRLLNVTDLTARIAVGESTGPAADRLPLAIAQIVLTATSVEGVDAVLLFQDGDALEAPLPGGELTSRPLYADDYAALLAPPETPSHKAVPTVGPTTTPS
jgi:hypothetical protein